MKASPLVFAPLIAFAVIAAAFAVSLTRDPSTIPSALIDRPAPTFDLAGIGGADGLSTDDLRGGVTLLNVFGSWCVSCRVEHPFLLELAADPSVRLYGLNWKDPPEAAQNWLDRLGDPYAKIGADEDGRVAIDFGVTGAPETFVIDRDGRIRFRYVGPLSPETWVQEIRPIIAAIENDGDPYAR
ncbi:MAG: DsbE family thiol:disulfide interchange protein [Pseudomonadota bacterium]